MQLPISEDPRRMARASDPVTSKKSAVARGRADRLFKVLEVIRSFESGCVSDDVLDALGFGHEEKTGPKSYSGITGAYCILERQRFIEYTGSERRGHRFGKLQQVMRALSESERTAKLERDFDILSRNVTERDVSKITNWYNANELLCQARAAEEDARQALIEELFLNPPPGEYSINIGYGKRLCLKVNSSKTYLTMKEQK